MKNSQHQTFARRQSVPLLSELLSLLDVGSWMFDVPRRITPCTAPRSLLKTSAVATESGVAAGAILISSACSSFEPIRNDPASGLGLCGEPKSISWGVKAENPNGPGSNPCEGRAMTGQTNFESDLLRGFLRENPAAKNEQHLNERTL